MVARLATDRWRRLQGWRAALSRTGPPEPVPPPNEDAVLLAGALRQLPAAQRQALALHYLFEQARRPAGIVQRRTRNLAYKLPQTPQGYVPDGSYAHTITLYRPGRADDFLRELRAAVRDCPT
ncbi:hypothetical protein [Micromonospora sp. NPDC023633]|uniref:hypothetical protein n=1 Tax=Micromonospora sp. NPDC023633 TaxID=3154320 RepID=UPI0033C3E405